MAPVAYNEWRQTCLLVARNTHVLIEQITKLLYFCRTDQNLIEQICVFQLDKKIKQYFEEQFKLDFSHRTDRNFQGSDFSIFHRTRRYFQLDYANRTDILKGAPGGCFRKNQVLY